MKYKKIKKFLFIGILVVICIISGGYFLNAGKNETTKKVKAATLPITGSVTLDDGDSTNEYVVPADATGLGGLDLPGSQGWFQNDGIIPSLSKNVINTYTSNVDDSSNYVGTLSNGDVLFQVKSSGSSVIGFPSTSFIFRTSIIKTQQNGEKLSQVYIATGTPSYDPSANFSNTAKESARDASVIEIQSNNRVQGLYLGTMPTGDTIDRKYVYDFNAATMSDFSWNQLSSDDSSLLNAYTFGNIKTLPNQNDGKLYVCSGGMAVARGNISNVNGFKLVEYTKIGNKIRETGKFLDLGTYPEITGETPASNIPYIQMVFTNIRKYGNYYLFLGYHGTYSDKVTSVNNIYKVNASDGSRVNLKQVSDKGMDIKRATIIEGLTEADPSHYYYMDYSNQKSRLMKLEPNSFTSTLVKEFPKGTTIRDITKYTNGKGEDEYSIYMTADSEAIADPTFNPYLNSPGIVLGTLDKNFGVKNLRGVSATGTLTLASFSPISNSNHYAIAGSATIDSDFIQGPFNKKDGATTAAFYGTFTQNDDYSPGIKFTKESIVVDITASDSEIEAKLMDGIKVTDTYDFSANNISGQKDEAWLEARINRNPKRINYTAPVGQQFPPIDWEALGFDKTKAGPQKVKYFVSDGSLQSSAISRWINKKDEETVTDEDDKYALDVQNFHVPLSDVTKPAFNEEAFKKLAKTMAWNMTDHEPATGDQGNGLDEDGASEKFSNTKVEVNAAQLSALQSATVAKPYPVDVTYKPGDGTEITNRAWVFVTTTNTVPNTETNVTPVDTKGVVYYADDYEIPYRSRLDQDLDSVLTQGKVKAYNYYAKDRTNELAPLPDSTNGVSNWSISNLSVIHNPFSGVSIELPKTVQPKLTYTWTAATDRYHTNGQTTEGSLGVTLSGDALLHVRQVIQNPNEEIVVPKEGYLSIQNSLDNGGNLEIDPDYQSQVTIISGKKTDNPDFTTFGINTESLIEDVDQINLSAIVPEFYRCVGYSLSNDKASHPNNPNSTETRVSLSRGIIYSQGEFWITLYLEPNDTNDGKPQPYSWDYKHNDLGKITD